jgi:hypothetical protein
MMDASIRKELAALLRERAEHTTEAEGEKRWSLRLLAADYEDPTAGTARSWYESLLPSRGTHAAA